MDWDPGDLQSTADDQLANHPMPANWTTVKDWANNRGTTVQMCYRIDDWESQQVDYHLSSK